MYQRDSGSVLYNATYGSRTVGNEKFDAKTTLGDETRLRAKLLFDIGVHVAYCYSAAAP